MTLTVLIEHTGQLLSTSILLSDLANQGIEG